MKQDEPALRGVRRIVAERIDSTIRILGHRSLGDEQVHEARKEMKRLRAGLRLLRSSLGNTVYRRLNRSVRDAARPLTPIRDAKVLRDAFDDVLHEAGKSVSNAQAGKVLRLLRQEHRASRSELTRTALSAVTGRLREVRRQLDRVPEARLDATPVDAALERAYKKARKALVSARRDPGNEQLHEWRKQVKYHMLQLEFLQPLAPKRLGATIKAAHKLTDYLGDDHDLALLHEKIIIQDSQAPGASNAAARDGLVKELRRVRAKLQRKAFRLGRKLYADKPKQIAKRMKKYANAWRKQTN